MPDLTDADLEAMEKRCEKELEGPWPHVIYPAHARSDVPALIAALREAQGELEQEIHLVFDGPPEHVAGRFVEAENSAGESISVGRWEQRGEYWHLIIPRAAEVERVKRLEKVAEAAREHLHILYCPHEYRPVDDCSTWNYNDGEPCPVMSVCAALAELDAGEEPC